MKEKVLLKKCEDTYVTSHRNYSLRITSNVQMTLAPRSSVQMYTIVVIDGTMKVSETSVTSSQGAIELRSVMADGFIQVTVVTPSGALITMSCGHVTKVGGGGRTVCEQSESLFLALCDKVNHIIHHFEITSLFSFSFLFFLVKKKMLLREQVTM